MLESLEQLDLLLVQVAKRRQVRRDGIRFAGLRYISTTLAAYIGESVTLRIDPRDLGEVRVFHRGRFLYRWRLLLLWTSALAVDDLRPWLMACV
jgi:putative transposase